MGTYTLQLPSGSTAVIQATATFGDLLVALLLIVVICIMIANWRK